MSPTIAEIPEPVTIGLGVLVGLFLLFALTYAILWAYASWLRYKLAQDEADPDRPPAGGDDE